MPELDYRVTVSFGKDSRDARSLRQSIAQTLRRRGLPTPKEDGKNSMLFTGVGRAVIEQALESRTRKYHISKTTIEAIPIEEAELTETEKLAAAELRVAALESAVAERTRTNELLAEENSVYASLMDDFESEETERLSEELRQARGLNKHYEAQASELGAKLTTLERRLENTVPATDHTRAVRESKDAGRALVAVQEERDEYKSRLEEAKESSAKTTDALRKREAALLYREEEAERKITEAKKSVARNEKTISTLTNRLNSYENPKGGKPMHTSGSVEAHYRNTLEVLKEGGVTLIKDDEDNEYPYEADLAQRLKDAEEARKQRVGFKRMKKDLQSKEARIEELEGELQPMSDTYSMLQRKYDILETQNEELTAERNSLESKLEEEGKHLEHLRTELDELQARGDIPKEAYEELQERYEVLERDIERKKAVITAKETALEQVNKRIKQYESDLTKLKGEISGHQATLATRASKIAELQNANTRLSERVREESSAHTTYVTLYAALYDVLIKAGIETYEKDGGTYIRPEAITNLVALAGKARKLSSKVEALEAKLAGYEQGALQPDPEAEFLPYHLCALLELTGADRKERIVALLEKHYVFLSTEERKDPRPTQGGGKIYRAGGILESLDKLLDALPEYADKGRRLTAQERVRSFFTAEETAWDPNEWEDDGEKMAMDAIMGYRVGTGLVHRLVRESGLQASGNIMRGSKRTATYKALSLKKLLDSRKKKTGDCKFPQPVYAKKSTDLESELAKLREEKLSLEAQLEGTMKLPERSPEELFVLAFKLSATRTYETAAEAYARVPIDKIEELEEVARTEIGYVLDNINLKLLTEGVGVRVKDMQSIDILQQTLDQKQLPYDAAYPEICEMYDRAVGQAKRLSGITKEKDPTRFKKKKEAKQIVSTIKKKMKDHRREMRAAARIQPQVDAAREAYGTILSNAGEVFDELVDSAALEIPVLAYSTPSDIGYRVSFVLLPEFNSIAEPLGYQIAETCRNALQPYGMKQNPTSLEDMYGSLRIDVNYSSQNILEDVDMSELAEVVQTEFSRSLLGHMGMKLKVTQVGELQ
jgi:archaellum component FlaC